jgi:hypothetical protein
MSNTIIQEETGEIKLEGSLKIQDIAALKEKLEGALTQTDKLKIDHSGGRSFDLSYLQLLISLKKTAALQNKSIEIAEKHPVEFYALVKDAGCISYKWLNIEFEDDIEKGVDNG